MKSTHYETLNQVQGDKIVVTTQPLRGEGWGEGIRISVIGILG
jgi:hypothetical protein